MATFRYAAGVLTEEWASTQGEGGIRAWVCSGICLDTLLAHTELGRNQLLRWRFTDVPYRRELVVTALDGTTPVIEQTIDVRPGSIHALNTAPARYVYRCVKLGPVSYAYYAPEQDSGAFAGLSVMQYQVRFQPLLFP